MSGSSPIHETGRVTRVPFSSIHRDDRGWVRAGEDLERIVEFQQLYIDQGLGALPLIEVVSDLEDGFVVADGNHRFEALSETNIEELDVLVLPVPPGSTVLDVCFERGLITAARSALRLTRAEKHAAILHLKGTRSLSNHEIADLVGCSHQTVGRVLSQSNGPEDETSTSDRLPPSDLEVATRLLRGIERVYEARGIGLWDALTGDHTGERLAEVLDEAYGEDALRFATRVRTWVDRAIQELKGRA